MLLLDYWPLKRFSRQAVIEKIPFFVITSVSVFITIGSQGRTAHADLPTGSIWLMIPLILCHNIIFYPYKMLWPANLSSHYSFPDPLALSQPMVLAGVIGTCLLILLLLFSLRWTRAFLVGWLFFFVAIFPTMGVIGFTDVIASDKYAYLPSVGFLIALTWFLNRWWPSKKPPARALIVVVVLMCVVAEAHATRSYLAVWKTSETLGRHMQHLAPRAWPLHDFMGNVFLQDGKNREAADEYRQALQRNPNEADLHYNFGLALARQGQTDEAVAQYREALRLKTNHLKAHNNLGIVLARQGHHDAALAEYRLAVDLNPELEATYTNLGQELAQKGQLDEAVKNFNRVLQLKPDQADAYNNLGNVMTVQGRPDEAIAYYHTALRLKPDYVDAHLNLGRILQRQGRTAESIDEYREVLRINPRHQQARQLLQSATSQPAGTPASRN